ncbi:MAG: substrate-binding domain-containing protein [Anaplasma sp.]
MRFLGLVLVAVTAVSLSFSACAYQIKVVGSSTVFPFISSVAEEFGRFSAYRTPVIESVGSGMGFNMFCSGSDEDTPDVAMSSRKIKDAEVELCNANGVKDMIEICLGYDGIVVASSKHKEEVDFSLRDLFGALSKYSLSIEYRKVPLNKYGLWSEIRPGLPEHEIEIYGPHKNTGTYDIMVESVVSGVCMSAKNFVDSYPDMDERKRVCNSIRNDGKYIEVATSENVVIHKISKNSNAFGILSFSFLVKNRNEIRGNKVAGVEPSYETISSGKYVLSRPIYIYVKREHLKTTPGLREFVKEVLRPESIGSNGYLASLGFVSLQDEQLAQTSRRVEQLIAG